MDSDDSNISDHVGDLDIQPYQFEPLCSDESQQEREHSTSEDSDIDESSQGQLKTISSQIGPKSNRLQSNRPQSNRPQFKSASSQIGLKMKVISAQKNKNKKRINK